MALYQFAKIRPTVRVGHLDVRHKQVGKRRDSRMKKRKKESN